MATQFPEPIPMPRVDPIATAINQSIDRLIHSLHQRRVHLLTLLRDTREEMRHHQVALRQMDEQLVDSRRILEGLMTHNELHAMQVRIVAEMEAKRAELQANAPPPQEVRFLCDTRDLEEHISHLGEIVRLDIPPYPSYASNTRLCCIPTTHCCCWETRISSWRVMESTRCLNRT